MLHLSSVGAFSCCFEMQIQSVQANVLIVADINAVLFCAGTACTVFAVSEKYKVKDRVF
jgi:hypothetical protein